MTQPNSASTTASEALIGLALIEERNPGLLDVLRESLLHDLASKAAPQNSGLSAEQPFPDEDMAAAISWLVRAGAIQDVGPPPSTHGETLEEVTRDSVILARLLPEIRGHLEADNAPELMVTWPRLLPVPEDRPWRTSRVGLTRLLESASENAWLLFPFVDERGISEVVHSLKRALDRGVKVVLATRHLDDPTSANSRLAEELRAAGKDERLFRSIHLKSSDSDGAGRELIHAKVVVVDDGRAGYIGSLNLTGSSMDDVLEIGVLVSGSAARSLQTLVWSLANVPSAISRHG